MQNEVVEPWGTYLENGKSTSAPIFDVTFTKIELKSSLNPIHPGLFFALKTRAVAKSATVVKNGEKGTK